MDTKATQNNGVARRVLIGGLGAGALCWFGRDLKHCFGKEADTQTDSSTVRPDSQEPADSDSPFEHFAEQTHITAIVGEPVICEILSLLRDVKIPISYDAKHSVMVTANNGALLSPLKTNNRDYEYRGNSVGGSISSDTQRFGIRLSYAVNRVYALNKPGKYIVTFHLDMPWWLLSQADIEAQQEFHDNMMQWSQSEGRSGEMPKLADSTAPRHPHRATVTVEVRLLSANRDKLMESAHSAAQIMIRSLLGTKINEVFWRQNRKIEAFWCYPDAVLIPVARQELLPLKDMLEYHATELGSLFKGQARLNGEAGVAFNALNQMLAAQQCPTLSPARKELVLWLTEAVPDGKNESLRRMVQPLRDAAMRPV